ncbi:MAG: hypothetical protein ACOC2U_01385 [bacterium]
MAKKKQYTDNEKMAYYNRIIATTKSDSKRENAIRKHAKIANRQKGRQNNNHGIIKEKKRFEMSQKAHNRLINDSKTKKGRMYHYNVQRVQNQTKRLLTESEKQRIWKDISKMY